MDKKIQEAITIIQQGGIVIYPTDTAFGIGCRIDDKAAIQRLFSLRKRPESQATPVLVESIAMAKTYLQTVPSDVEKTLMKQYWPGAVTIVLGCIVEKVPDLVRGGTATLGVRVPNHETALALIKGAGMPLLGPSANFHGDATPYSFEDLNPDLMRLVDYVLPGECPVKMASTVIDCTQNPWKILRQGVVTIEAL